MNPYTRPTAWLKIARNTVARIAFDPRDVWVGVYWNVQGTPNVRVVDVYVCLIPTLPLHIRRFEYGRFEV